MSIIKKYLGPEELKKFFIVHLNKIYGATAQLLKRLPQMGMMANFKELQNTIPEAIILIKEQMSRMDDIYKVFNTKFSNQNKKGFTCLVEDAFTAVKQHHDPVQRDMSMLFYLQNIKSVEMASFQLLQVAAVKLKNDSVKRLLKENFESAKANKAILQVLTAKYITG